MSGHHGCASPVTRSAGRQNRGMTFVDPKRLLNHRRYRPTGDGTAPEAAGSGRPVRRIVLTGGPGSGKSTAAAFLAREFVDELWVLPESATLLYKGGLPRATSDLGQQIAQRAIFTVQRSLEEAAGLQHANRTQLCDRATVDGAAYWPDGPDAFFRSMGSSREAELARYDVVIFMHTAAKLPAGYERDLDQRTEDTAEAIALDQRIFQLYADHPRLVTIESSVSFLDKLTAVHDAIEQLVRPEDPAPLSALMGLASVQHVLPVD